MSVITQGATALAVVAGLTALICWIEHRKAQRAKRLRDGSPTEQHDAIPRRDRRV